MSGNFGEPFCFDSQLLHHIESFENDAAKSMLLDRDLCRAVDDWGSLLHYAASHGNAEIASHLIELGSEVDGLAGDEKGSRRTPLMTAVKCKQPAVVRVLLDAHADISATIDVDGEDWSALEMAIGWDFECSHVDVEILRVFLRRVQSDSTDVDQLIDKLLEAGCSMYHFVHLRDLRAMVELLARGFDVDHAGPRGMTALHAAVELEDARLVEWLVDEAYANVNVTNVDDNAPLFFAALRGHAKILRFLLDRGADPNAGGEYAPLFVTFSASRPDTRVRFDECAELLLRRGAVPRNSPGDRFGLCDYALITKSYGKLNMLLCRLAMMEATGEKIVESVLRIRDGWHKTATIADLEDSYEMCRAELETRVFREVTLNDLLTMRDRRMLRLVRNETFVPRVMDVCCEREWIVLYPYFYGILQERISTAVRARTLETMAVSAICNVFEVNVDLYYIFAREVVGWLSERDLEMICGVPTTAKSE